MLIDTDDGDSGMGWVDEERAARRISNVHKEVGGGGGMDYAPSLAGINGYDRLGWVLMD